MEIFTQMEGQYWDLIVTIFWKFYWKTVPMECWFQHISDSPTSDFFGAASWFDTMEECFEDLTSYVHAVETGLSSDPPMNWRLSALDGLQLISNSDAHSPSKLGREANLLDIELSYRGLYGAVQYGKGLLGTLEFFPEEGANITMTDTENVTSV